jgi:peptidoglycan hydrolase-like protein with peptidoglycan-binding domain
MNALIRLLLDMIEKEFPMPDAETDRREGYTDGLAGKRQQGRSITYRDANDDGAFDLQMSAMVAEWKRRAALPEPEQ